MKPIVTFLLIALSLGCSSKKDFNPTTISLLEKCDSKANCTIKIMPGKGLFVQSTNDTKANSLLYIIEDNSNKMVIQYKFKRTSKGNVQDANYQEEIIFELDKNVRPISFKDQQLQATKMIFSRSCFCEGKTGLFAVTQGTLSIDANHNGILDFTVPGVPQITNRVSFNLK